MSFMRRSSVEQLVIERWYADNSGPSLLQPLAALFATVMRVRRAAYSNGWLRSYRVSKPVVVVGNLTIGGTGKTPLVIWLAQRLSDRGLRVGIVSRGYARTQSTAVPQVVHAGARWQDVGDEPVLLRDRTGCDVVVARDRVAGARLLVTRGADVIIADDGLQHLRLARECEIVVVDGARGFGNGRVLPAGPLREPVSRLAQVDVIVVNGAPELASPGELVPPRQAASQQAIAGSGPPLRMRLVPGEIRRLDGGATAQPLEHFRGCQVHAVAGIGNPSRFFEVLRARGIEVIEHAFPDHHPFTDGDLAFGDALPVLMTEKDAVKCRAFADPRLWYVPVTATFSEAHSRELLQHVARKLGG